MSWIDFDPWEQAYAEIYPTRRKPNFLALMQWLVEAAFVQLKQRFDDARRAQNLAAGEIGRRHALEVKLSQAFGEVIRVVNRRRNTPHVWIDTEAEGAQPLQWIATEDESAAPLWINLESEDALEYDFEVRLPFLSTIDRDEVANIVNQLKPAGKTYIILPL